MTMVREPKKPHNPHDLFGLHELEVMLEIISRRPNHLHFPIATMALRHLKMYVTHGHNVCVNLCAWAF